MPMIAVAGNHDFRPEVLRALPWTYLEDEAAEVLGLRFWGSPWSNPSGYGWAFNKPENEQRVLFREIPDDTDIIVSHGPPFERCDLTAGYQLELPSHVGSRALRERMDELPDLKLVACGHIHPAYGKEDIVINGSLVDGRYRVRNKPYVVEI